MRDDSPNPGAPSIKTLSKDRIGQGWSYPLAAGEIAHGLIGAPQIGLLTLSFRGPSQLALKGIGDTFRIVEVRYLCRGAGVFMPRDSELVGRPEWRLFVDAVPRALRHAIATRLQTSGLPALRAALVACGTLDGREGEASVQLRYDHLDDNIALAQDFRVQPERRR